MRDKASFTAEITCAARLLPSKMNSFANGFLSRRGRLLLAGWRLANRMPARLPQVDLGMAYGIEARHRFIDAALLAAVESGVRQVVLLGAGYDTRPWRLAAELGQTRVFLVDHPLTATRRALLSARMPTNDSTRVDVDFAHEDFGDRLVASGFDPERLSFFSWEGVSMYLPESAIRKTLSRCHELSTEGSGIAFDALCKRMPGLSAVSTAWPLALAVLQRIGEPIGWREDLDGLDSFVGSLGYRVLHGATTATLAREAGRRAAFGGLSVVSCARRS